MNLEADPGPATCVGIAFEFPEEKWGEVLDYIIKREGRGFDSTNKRGSRLESGDQVTAVVAIYSGENLLSGKSLVELVAIVRATEGVNGPCIDYVTNLAAKLSELGINDLESMISNALLPISSR